MATENENAINAEQLFAVTLNRYQIEPGSLCVHSDRGAPMTSSLLQDAFIEHEIAPGFSRPQVSNDNPHTEASFRTMKARPDMPKRFHYLQEARIWVNSQVQWYHQEHHHTALALFTPADVFFQHVFGAPSATAGRTRCRMERAHGAFPPCLAHGLIATSIRRHRPQRCSCAGR
jgi:putative transposase